MLEHNNPPSQGEPQLRRYETLRPLEGAVAALPSSLRGRRHQE